MLELDLPPEPNPLNSGTPSLLSPSIAVGDEDAGGVNGGGEAMLLESCRELNGLLSDASTFSGLIDLARSTRPNNNQSSNTLPFAEITTHLVSA